MSNSSCPASVREAPRAQGWSAPRYVLFALCALMLGCESADDLDTGSPAASVDLTVSDVERLVVQAVEQAQRLGETVVIAVTDREGNILATYSMDGTSTGADEAVQKARTGAFLSSNQHGFTTLTACFITREHFPPGVPNAPGGPLFGVGFSSLDGSDIQPNGSGLTGAPGGVPVFKGGILAGGIGVTGGSDGANFDAVFCSNVLADEIIALGAVIGYSVSDALRGDQIFLDGIRLLFANGDTPRGEFTLTPGDLDGSKYLSGPVGTPVPTIPEEGVVSPVQGSTQTGGLTAGEVNGILDAARAQAARTRAAIRKPIGSPAQVFITVVDTDGSVLGMWRTPDATLFSMDVSAQKARTAVAFSTPSCTGIACPTTVPWPGERIRALLGLQSGDPLAMTTRAVGFLAQDFFPPGIDEETLDRPIGQGPLFEIQQQFLADAAYGGLGPLGNGLTIFPGGIPLYKNGILVGAVGVSGDGVDQDDLIAAAGADGFEPPTGIRCDHFFYDGIRLPYVKFPREAEL